MDDKTDFFEMSDDVAQTDNAVIRVIGVGGGGGNAVGYMYDSRLDGVDFIVANTDCKALKTLSVDNQIALGQSLTKGLGAGSDPDRGQKAALEDQEVIKQQLAGSDMVFITAGMGGGTGTGAAPVVARIAREEVDALTVAVVTTPFQVEGKRKRTVAEEGIQELSELVDALIIVPNQKLLKAQKQLSMKDAFGLSNSVLLDAVRGISELITRPGIIGVDFADVCAAMKGMGPCVVGHGEVKNSPSAAYDACMAAIKNPLLEDADLSGAKGVLANVTGGPNLTVQDYEEVGKIIEDFADDDALIKIGMAEDENLDDSIRVTIVATGIGYHEIDISSTEANASADSAAKQQPAEKPHKVQSLQRAHLRPAFANHLNPGGDRVSRSERISAQTSQKEEEADSRVKIAGMKNTIDIPTFMRQQMD